MFISFSLVFAFGLSVCDIFWLLWFLQLYLVGTNELTFSFSLSFLLPFFVSCMPFVLSGHTYYSITTTPFCFSLGSTLNIFDVFHPSFGCGFFRFLLVSSSYSNFLEGLLGKLFPDFFYLQSCLYLLYWKDGLAR